MNSAVETTLEVVEQPHVVIPMSDGCRLSARIWMPENAHNKPIPAIVEHIPYRKRDGTTLRDELTHPWMAARGYACIRTDMRGSGESEGVLDDEYSAQELQDACDVIAWACKQPWCNGSIGMMGISWGGFNSLQVAALQPAGLKAIITLCSTVDRFADDIHYKGGCLLNENLGWAANMLSYSSPPPDPMLVGESWKTMWLNRLEQQPFHASVWLRQQSRNAYWQHGSVCEDYTQIKAAVLSIGGWHDGYRNTISHLVTNLASPVKGIVGPWIHKYPHYAAPQPAIGFLQEALRWWDCWLKNKNTGVEQDPAYRVWLMESVKPERWLDARPGQWISEPYLPSPNIKTSHWFFDTPQSSERADNQQHIAGILSIENSNTDLDVTIASDQTCGEATGEYFPFTFGPELPDDQTIDDHQSVCFDGELINTHLDIVGAPELKLSVSSNQAKGFVVVRLCDLRPDGTSALISMGVQNLCHHVSAESPAVLEPNKVYQVNVVLDQIAYRIGEGHRLRVAISNAYWPLLWPSPTAATLSLKLGELALPLRSEANQSSVAFEPPTSAPGWQVESLRASSSTREITSNKETGAIVTVIENDFGENLDLDHGLRSGGKVTEHWSIKPNDPHSASANIHWQQTGGRENWHWQTDATVSMTCDTDSFYVHAKLVVRNDDEIIFEKEFTDTIAREFV